MAAGVAWPPSVGIDHNLLYWRWALGQSFFLTYFLPTDNQVAIIKMSLFYTHGELYALELTGSQYLGFASFLQCIDTPH